MLKPVNQIAIRNNSGLVKASEKDKDDSLEFWYKVYFSHAVTTSQASQKVQVRDISLFIRFAEKEGVTYKASVDTHTLAGISGFFTEVS